jgi:hypothetical protein
VKREVLERSTAELAAARTASDDARYELARHLNTVSSANKWIYTDLLRSCALLAAVGCPMAITQGVGMTPQQGKQCKQVAMEAFWGHPRFLLAAARRDPSLHCQPPALWVELTQYPPYHLW